MDRAALDAAIELEIPQGGWCPTGRWSEDGPISAKYLLRETPAADPAQRTGWNVFDSDATLILASEPLGGGSALAADVARRFGRPQLVVDPTSAGDESTLGWMSTLPDPLLLNIAGPRESEFAGAYRTARVFLSRLLGAVIDRKPATGDGRRRALVTGGGGLLGGYLLRLAPPFWEVMATTRQAADRSDLRMVELSDAPAVDRLVDELRPDVVIHTAYGTRDAERDIWFATKNVTDAAANHGAHLVHLSSDMVLDGEGAPYDETAQSQPVNEYGRWKARAEDYLRGRLPGATVVRLSLITAFAPPDPRTDWIVRGLLGGHELSLFVDELRTPILADDLARQIWEIVRLEGDRRAGVWNLAGPEALSRFALGVLVATAFGFDPGPINPALAGQAPGRRPRDLRLLTPRADAELLTRARPLSLAAAGLLSTTRSADQQNEETP